MSTTHSGIRTQVAIDGGVFLLDDARTPDDLKDRLQDAARSAGTFVDLDVVGDRTVSVLVSQASRVVISVGPTESGDEDFAFPNVGPGDYDY